MTLLLLFNHPPLHEDLLNSAHHFIAQSHYGVAVVLAQTAFEVFTAQVRSQLIQKRQLTAMGDWIAKGTRRVDARIDFYVAVTRDQIQQDGALWPQYSWRPRGTRPSSSARAVGRASRWWSGTPTCARGGMPRCCARWRPRGRRGRARRQSPRRPRGRCAGRREMRDRTGQNPPPGRRLLHSP